jgi:hypothetical protein
MMRRVILAVTTLASIADAPALAADTVDFIRDIRPVLSDACFQCHGPDERKREAGLRLDRRDGAISVLESGETAIVAGHADKSELIRRITSADPGVRMPPAESSKRLSAEQIQLLRRWIDTGAQWDDHWSFVPPAEVSPPISSQQGWVRNGIDSFIERRLDAEGLQPSPVADRRQLIRRVTFDLTGLPPSLEDVEAFVHDVSPDAYEKVVDRLLASPHYGERMTMRWLDAARYADTHGYTFDSERSMWRYRDWVIDAFNQNMPFDQFTVEQIAGDLLPEATRSQQIASAFNRNHVINSELGAIDQEYLVENVADRVNTVGTVWMGLTLECARCHDHKFDPVSQREFYELYAFFNNIPERGLDGMFSNAGPSIPAPTPEQEAQQLALDTALKEAEAAMQKLRPQIDAAQAIWEAKPRRPVEDVREDLVSWWPFDANAEDQLGGESKASDNGGGPLLGGGVIGRGAVFFGLNSLKAPAAGRLDRLDSFSLACWVNTQTTEGRRSLFTRMPEGVELQRGYAFQIHDGHLAFSLVHDTTSRLDVESVRPIESHRWQHVVVTYDGSGRASGVRLYIDGASDEARVINDALDGSIDVSEPLMIGDGTPNAGMKGTIDESRIYGRVLDDEEIKRLPGLPIESLLAVEVKSRTPETTRRIREYFLHDQPHAEWRDAYFKLAELNEKKASLERSIPTVMVMQERKDKPIARILAGGAYDQPGEQVDAATPDFLPPMADELPRNRLGLAQWLVSPTHPLTARVTVNRFWQMYFGTGLVRTAEDFGSQGEPPSHPELLDWLARRFVASGWDVRAMQRLIVTSATYQQASHITPELLKRDPENRLLARGPRFRLDAESIRDQALLHAGLLVNHMGGPSVRPYQPPGLWEEGAFDPTGNRWSAQRYEQDTGELLYRRSMYTFWKRTAPPPAMLVFDAPERTRCVVRRDRTNTPLQALVLMNDPTYVEASRGLADRILREAGPDDSERMQFAFRVVTSREPSASELATMLQLLERQLAKFEADPASAVELLAVGESPRDSSVDPTALAAYTTVASVLLSLDEVLTKN